MTTTTHRGSKTMNTQYVIATPINTTQGIVVHVEHTLSEALAHIPEGNSNLSISEALFIVEIDPSSDFSRMYMDINGTDQPYLVGDLIAPTPCN